MPEIPPPSEAFLTELVERARRYGWGGDYTELITFMQQLYREAKLPPPDLNAYEICEKCDEIMPLCKCDGPR